MSVHFGKEKFHAAITCLVEAGDIHARLNAALTQYLIHINVNEDLPEAFREDFEKFLLTLGRDENGHVTESINAKSESEVENIAKQLVQLYEKLLTTYRGNVYLISRLKFISLKICH